MVSVQAMAVRKTQTVAKVRLQKCPGIYPADMSIHKSVVRMTKRDVQHHR